MPPLEVAVVIPWRDRSARPVVGPERVPTTGQREVGNRRGAQSPNRHAGQAATGRTLLANVLDSLASAPSRVLETVDRCCHESERSGAMRICRCRHQIVC